MLEDDIVKATKRTVASTFGPRSNSRGKGKRSQQDRDGYGERDGGALVYTSGHRGAVSSEDRPSENSKLDNDSEQIRFTISPA